MFDYPSSTLVSELLNERDIIPIFAVDQRVRSVYTGLRSIIRSAIIGELTDQANDLLTVVEEGYQASYHGESPPLSIVLFRLTITLTKAPFSKA